MVSYRSFSQWSQENRCPEAYRLSRIERVWRRPAAWTPMGTAVHAAVEAWERSDRFQDADSVKQVFRDVYREEVDKLLEQTPNPEYWFSSGPYKGADDIERRFVLGQEHVQRYIDWYKKHPTETVYTLPDGRPGLEVPFRIHLGSVEVRGVSDWIGKVKGKLRPRDNKTGRKPGQTMQLKIQAIALEEHLAFHGTPEDVLYGDFFMTRTGKPTVDYDLSTVTRDVLVEEFEGLEARIQSGRFEPKPDPEVCWSCEVRDSCKYRAD